MTDGRFGSKKPKKQKDFFAADIAAGTLEKSGAETRACGSWVRVRGSCAG